jgi:transposase
MYHETAVVGQTRQRAGLMVWACFAGTVKGPLIIWNPSWGRLNSINFITYVVPKIDEFNAYLWEHHQIDALLMQDGAPCHWSYETTEELEDLDVSKTDHPPISPDLNPQENLWNWLEDYVSKRTGFFGDIRREALTPYILEGRDALPESILENLVYSMPRRVQQLLERDGGATTY